MLRRSTRASTAQSRKSAVGREVGGERHEMEAARGSNPLLLTYDSGVAVNREPLSVGASAKCAIQCTSRYREHTHDFKFARMTMG